MGSVWFVGFLFVFGGVVYFVLFFFNYGISAFILNNLVIYIH